MDLRDDLSVILTLFVSIDVNQEFGIRFNLILLGLSFSNDLKASEIFLLNKPPYTNYYFIP